MREFFMTGIPMWLFLSISAAFIVSLAAYRWRIAVLEIEVTAWRNERAKLNPTPTGSPELARSEGYTLGVDLPATGSGSSKSAVGVYDKKTGTYHAAERCPACGAICVPNHKVWRCLNCGENHVA